jgi:hypothetical protein
VNYTKYKIYIETTSDRVDAIISTIKFAVEDLQSKLTDEAQFGSVREEEVIKLANQLNQAQKAHALLGFRHDYEVVEEESDQE